MTNNRVLNLALIPTESESSSKLIQEPAENIDEVAKLKNRNIKCTK